MSTNNEVVGIGIEARLEAFRKQMGEIPGIGAKEARALATQLSQEIKATEKASKAAEKAAKDAAKSQDKAAKGAKNFADQVGKGDEASKKLGQAFGAISPELGAVVTGLSTMADGYEGVAAAGEALGVSLASVATVAIPVGAAIAGLVLWYQNLTRETQQLTAMRKLESEVAASLIPSERALADAKLASEVATGKLTESEAKEVSTKEAARRAVLDYAAAQKSQRAEISESIATSERNLAIMHSTVKALLLLAAAPILPVIVADAAIEGVDAVKKRLEDTTNQIVSTVDSVIGWGDSISDAKDRLKVLDGAVKTEAENQKELAATNLQTAHAQDAASAAAKRREKAEKELAEVIKASQEKSKSLLDALSTLDQLEAQANQNQLSDLEKLTAARNEQLQQAEGAAAEAMRNARDNASALSSIEAELADTRLAIEADYTQQAQKLKDQQAKDAEEAAKKSADADKKATEERTKMQQQILGYAQQGVGTLVSGLEDTSQKAAQNAQDLTEHLASLEEFYTASQKKEIKKRIDENLKAARRAFEIEKVGKIAAATVDTFAGATQALASAPPPLNFINAGLVTASGLANVASIAAQQPAFHAGGPVNIAPDESYRKVRDKEFINNPTGRSMLGDRFLERANAGIHPDSGITVIQAYKHTRQVDQYERDRLSAGNPIARKIMGSHRPGMEG